ncbi:MAG TPA: PfkB family carbohydrate kinase [Pseudonocardiaceae bacterium]|jgi:sugar/nucleoside kinase (ribokinase family)|nr:PfkB family carbohydrate kinase [Pseudonocardiaceae bacterium]
MTNSPPTDDIATPVASAEPEVDVFVSGLLFFDIVFTGLRQPPTPGTEIWTGGMGSGPGGIANLAIPLRRLGMRTALAAAFGPDVYGEYCWQVLAEQEGVDLSRSRFFPGWHSPVTVSLAYQHDRALITHGHAPPVATDELIGQPPSSRAAFVHIGAEPQAWLSRANAAGSLVFADVGWDPSEVWPPEVLDQLACCHAFLPNETEATHYTRTESAPAALAKLADLLPVAVITRGREGALAVDNNTGETAAVPGLAVDALDATGAGDVFGAGFVVATLAGWPLVDRLRFANLTAALSVAHFGGALAAPGWAEIAQWWQGIRDDPRQRDVRAAYGFLDDAIPTDQRRQARRAPVTIGFVEVDDVDAAS